MQKYEIVVYRENPDGTTETIQLDLDTDRIEVYLDSTITFSKPLGYVADKANIYTPISLEMMEYLDHAGRKREAALTDEERYLLAIKHVSDALDAGLEDKAQKIFREAAKYRRAFLKPRSRTKQ